MAAARYGHPEVVRELIAKYGCDVNATKSVSQHAHILLNDCQVDNLWD